MKVAYFCALTQLDTDLSYIQELQNLCDLTVYIYANPKHFKKSIIKLNRLYDRGGIFDASIYLEFDFLKSLINLDRIKIINIPNSSHWEWRAFSLFFSLSSKLGKVFDIIHITSILQPSEFPLYRLGKRLVLTVHDPLPHSSTNGLKYRLARGLSMKVIRNFVIFNKVQKKEFVETYHLQNKRVMVSHFGVFPWMKLIETGESNDFINKSPYILFAGRISQYKGVNYLLPAMEKVHKQYPDINLIVAGGGQFHFNISKWEKFPYIEFRNRFIPDGELITLIRNSLFVVCPYTDATQSGVVMSAFTFNKPVLATNVGGLPEMIESGRYGLIVEERNVEALAKGMCWMLQDISALNTYSANIENDYSLGEKSWKQTAQQIVDFYSKIVAVNLSGTIWT